MLLCISIALYRIMTMHKRMKRLDIPRLDWDDMQCFLAISRLGSLSSAAKALGVTQPTMGRRLDRLHARVGAALLQRTPTGFQLTAAGERVLTHDERMDDEALAVGRALTGEDDRLAGEVRITTVEAFAAHILIPELPALLDEYPGLSVEIDVDTRSLSLARREADVAIRMASFQQHEIIVKRSGLMAFGVYASAGYLDRAGILTFDQTRRHRIITLQNTLIDMPEARWFDETFAGGHRALATNSREGQLQACLAGAGLACLPRYLADPRPELRLLDVGGAAPGRDIWIGTHRDTQRSAKIRAVLDWLAAVMQQARTRLNPA